MAADRHSPSSSTPLHKGRACINCRRRKIKCDGIKPVCTPCSTSSETFRDCEYSDSGFTRTQLLEEQIAVLEARLEQLERPEADSLTLHNPYAEFKLSSTSTSESETPEGSWTPATSSNATTFSEELPYSVHQTLVHTFLDHCSELGFFLDITRFRDAALGTVNPRNLSSALLNSIYLWGAHLSPEIELYGAQSNFASRAMQSTAQALSSDQPSGIIQCIQAEVLLALYFFRNAKIVQGKYHTSAAVSLVLSASLHKIGTPEPSSSDSLLFSPQGSVLGLPADDVEADERIKAFWTVVILNNCWTTADSSPSNISYGDPSRVDSPWPGEIQVEPHAPRTHTVQRFLAGKPDGGVSTLTLHAKASILFEQSARLVRQYHLGLTPESIANFCTAFAALDSLLVKFTNELPQVGHSAGSASATRNLIVIHTLSQVAILQLHNPFVLDRPSSRQSFLVATRAIVQLINESSLDGASFTDPIIGPLWVAACRALISEASRYSSLRLTRSLSLEEAQAESDLVLSIETIIQGMTVFAGSPLMESQLTRVREMYTQVQRS
ncbi:Zn(2)-Cys(6) binuclear cluster domain-containing protein [Mycena floridula]|nr:Zn(2)-Cys(6) binuclear cluster domain-containing protein [Mycena floridula]